ncbi:SRPBCC family protein [Kitasatospora aureofaciens]|uniref:SRPBCC family protein n=1 Tax=Kitasatospora aureofaciens TaxID=1894 RepID=UPI001C4522E2|nr:SRPBCC family protein [Kitasatospora aureofaciens]MBV6697216.1 SRPBCC family protein [Kitasatospora aureofaciens]
MVADSIEREIVIAAPRERVWEILTQAEFLGAWFGSGTPAEIDLRPGGRLVFDHGVHGILPARIERVERPEVFSYRWPQGAAGEEPAEGNATLVEFTLTPELGGTRLRMVESGFAALTALPAEAARARHEQNSAGWDRKLPELARQAEKLAA